MSLNKRSSFCSLYDRMLQLFLLPATLGCSGLQRASGFFSMDGPGHCEFALQFVYLGKLQGPRQPFCLNCCWQPGRKGRAHKSFTKTICQVVDVYNGIIQALGFRGYKWTNKGWKRNYVRGRMCTDLTYLWDIFTLPLWFEKFWFLLNPWFDKLACRKWMQNLKGKFCI